MNYSIIMKIHSLLYKRKNIHNLNFIVKRFSTIELINNNIMKYNPLVECESINRSSNKKEDEKIVLSNETIYKREQERKVKPKKTKYY